MSRLALVVLVLFLSACARPDPEQEAVQQQETARAILDSALEYSARGRSGDAIRLLRRAAAITPLDPVIHYDLGNSLARQGRLDEAAESYRRTISLKPDYAAAYYNLASVRSAAGRHQEAEELMAHSIEADRGYHPAHKALAQLRERRGDYEGAIESLEIAVGIKPSTINGLRRPHFDFILSVQDAIGRSMTPSVARAMNMPAAYPAAGARTTAPASSNCNAGR